jgi:hypothetical protein
MEVAVVILGAYKFAGISVSALVNVNPVKEMDLPDAELTKFHTTLLLLVAVKKPETVDDVIGTLTI